MNRPAPTPIDAFMEWLPDELEYSARKAGYDRKLERARKPIDDPQSIYGFLGQEWHRFQQQSRDGVHYLPLHALSGQLQLAKFAAGIFDKAAMAYWLQRTQSTEQDIAAFTLAARDTAGFINYRRPWQQVDTGVADELAKPFTETIFADGIKQIMSDLVVIAEMTDDGDDPFVETAELFDYAIGLGGVAVAYYSVYATENLRPSQYELPKSSRLN